MDQREGDLRVPLGVSSPVRVALGLGSNLGDRAENLRFARREIGRFLEELRCSRVYETEPRHVTDQPPFLNACCVGKTTLAPEELLARCREVERAAGRTRGGERYGPRVLDVDILLYGGRRVERPGLRIPHPRMMERAFVLVPLSEVAGRWVHPELGATVEELASRVSREGVEPYGTGGTTGWG